MAIMPIQIQTPSNTDKLTKNPPLISRSVSSLLPMSYTQLKDLGVWKVHFILS